jgi:replicative DNA helicase
MATTQERLSSEAPQSAGAILGSLRRPGRQVRTPVASGFDPLDEALGGGFTPGDLTLVGGIPGIGKTVATLQWAVNAAKQGRHAVYACYEHEPESLLTRVLMTEAGALTQRSDLAATERLREDLHAVTAGRINLDEAMHQHPLLGNVTQRFDAFAESLWLGMASGASTGLAELENMSTWQPETILFVDYLQKVFVPGNAVSDHDRVVEVVAGLKEIALRNEVPVVAVVSSDIGGLVARRVRLHHLRGSGALAFEADVAIMINEKVDAVSRVHTAFDSLQADRFTSQAVFTIEKNRDGPAPLDLEFNKDFEHYRFDPQGGYVAERLVDERFYTE